MKTMKNLKESTAELKWFRGGSYKANFFSDEGNKIDAKTIDENLDSIINKYDNCFPVKDDLTFEIAYWETYNGDNVSVEIIFNRNFDADEHGEVEDLLNNKLLEEYGFEDAEVHGTGYNSARGVREWSFAWYKYSDYNRDHTFKRPNSLDYATASSGVNGTEPFTAEEGMEIGKAVAEYIVKALRESPKDVYYAASNTVESVIIPEDKIRVYEPSWRGSYTHNTGDFGFSCYIEDFYTERETYRADEDLITDLLKRKSADILNDFLYEFNLEVVPGGCKANWYEGDESYGVFFEINIKFKEIGIDSRSSYFAHKGNSFKSYRGDVPKDLYKGKTFKRNPKKSVSESKSLKESNRDWYKFYIDAPKSPNKYWVGIYPTESMAKRCAKPIFKTFEIIGKEPLPTTLTQNMIDECPETAYVQAGNSTWSYNFYERVVSNDSGYPIEHSVFLVKNKEAFEEAKRGLVINSIRYRKTTAQVGDRIYWTETLYADKDYSSLKEARVKSFPYRGNPLAGLFRSIQKRFEKVCSDIAFEPSDFKASGTLKGKDIRSWVTGSGYYRLEASEFLEDGKLWQRLWEGNSIEEFEEDFDDLIKEVGGSDRLTEGVILHFDLENGDHEAIPFDSEEEALDYLDSDEFPIGEWTGSYNIETVEDAEDEEDYADEIENDESFYVVLDKGFYTIQEPVDVKGHTIYKDVYFSSKEEAIAYAEENPEAKYVQEKFGPGLADCYEGDFVWKRS